MLVIGLILIVIALVVVGYMWFGTTGLPGIDIDLAVFTLHLTPLEIFFLGAASILVLAIGTVLFAKGLRRQRARRKELRELRHIAEEKGAHDRVVRDDSPGREPARDREQRTAPGRATGSAQGRPAGERASERGAFDRPASDTRAGDVSSGDGAPDRPATGDRAADDVQLPMDHKQQPRERP